MVYGIVYEYVVLYEGLVLERFELGEKMGSGDRGIGVK